MLDELVEYKEYTDKKILDSILLSNKNKKSSKEWINNRLKYKQMDNDMAGLKRAYVIVAKYFLDKYNDANIAINALYAYAGLDYSPINKEIESIANYIDPTLFDFYYENCINTDNDERKIKKIEELRKKHKIKRFDEDIVNGDSLASKNDVSDFNKISFTDIVDNLLCKQDYSIKRRLLVCKKDVTKDIVDKKGKNIKNKQLDYVLKIIASYLIFNKDGCATKLIMSDIYNWALYKPEANDINDFVFANNENPIIKTNFRKMVFIDLCDEIKNNYFIVDFKDAKKIEYGDIVYIDKGAKDVMERIDIENSYDKMRLLQELEDVS